MNIRPFHSPTRNPLRYRNLLRAIAVTSLFFFAASAPAGAGSHGGRLDYKVGFLGIPSSATQFEMSVPVPWTRETVGQLKKLGFNTIQLDVAWGTRPGDEPLNIEDVVQLSAEQDQQSCQAAEDQSCRDLIMADQRPQPPDGRGTAEGLCQLGIADAPIGRYPVRILQKTNGEQDHSHDDHCQDGPIPFLEQQPESQQDNHRRTASEWAKAGCPIPICLFPRGLR